MKKTTEREFSRWWLISLVNFLFGFAVQGSIIFIPLLGAQLGASDFQIRNDRCPLRRLLPGIIPNLRLEIR